MGIGDRPTVRFRRESVEDNKVHRDILVSGSVRPQLYVHMFLPDATERTSFIEHMAFSTDLAVHQLLHLSTRSPIKGVQARCSFPVCHSILAATPQLANKQSQLARINQCDILKCNFSA